MPDFKEMCYMIMVMLVTISSIYTWAGSQPVLKEKVGISGVSGYDSNTIQDYTGAHPVSPETQVTTNPLTQSAAYIGVMVGYLLDLVGMVVGFLDGWIFVLIGVLKPIGLESLNIVFIAPLGLIQIIAVAYLFRDIVTAVAGLIP